MPHLAHLGCDLVFLIEFQASKSGLDDRYKRPPQKIAPPHVKLDSPEAYLLDLIARWLETEDDQFIEEALVVLNDIYGKGGDEAQTA
ncbi:hypothetical protein C6W92_16650 [Roseovarius sp. A46]|nr:hypothetical protein C6W92_16650 [Roseovarius sp. A46]